MKYPFILILLVTISAKGQDLQDYQQQAIENNPGLLAKYKVFEASLTKVHQVNSLPDPTLSFGYFISPVETRVGPQNARFSLSQMFPWFGTLKAQGDVAALSAEAIYQQFVEEQNRTRFLVAKAYYPLLELEATLGIQRENLELLEAWKRLATIQFENGKTSLVDVLRVDLMIKELETELSLLSEEKRPLTVTFNRLLNRADTLAVTLSDSSPLERFSNFNANWANHPRVLELNKRIEAKQKHLSVIEKQGLPKIGAGLDYMLVGERTDVNIPDNGKNAFMPMVTMSIPIFRRKYDEAHHETELNIEGYQFSLVAIENELSTKYENLKYQMEREQQLLNLYRIQIEETQQIQNLLFTGFSESGNDLDELLRIQMQLLAYEIKQVKSEKRLKTVAANMNYLLARQ